MVTATDIEKYLTPSQAAARCEVSPQTIVNWHRSGKLAGVETQHGLLVSPGDVERKARERHQARAKQAEVEYINE